MNPNAVKSLKGKICSDADSGVDLNRNYPLYWGTPETFTLGETASYENDDCIDPCGECYRGEYAFSEPETRALRDFISSHNKTLKFVVNLHSDGNQVIYPYNGMQDNLIE